MTPLTNNARRAARIDRVLTRRKDSGSKREGLIDLLADARHWCDRQGEDFAQLDRMAHQHYLAELNSTEGNTL